QKLIASVSPEEKIALRQYFTGNKERQADAAYFLPDCTTDDEKRDYLRSLVSTPDAKEFPSKRHASLKKIIPQKFLFGKLTEIFSEIKALIDSGEYHRFVITGNPGIGKSYFLFYILYELAKNGETVLLDSHDHDKCIVFKNGVVELETIGNLGYILNKNTTWYLVDTKKPMRYQAKTILVSSPNPHYYKEFLKYQYTTMRYMPIWSLNELRYCKDILFPDIEENEMLKGDRLGSLRGQLFEGYTHNILRKGGAFRVRKLGGNREEELVLESKDERLFAKLENVDVNLNYYFRPVSKKFASIDSLIPNVGLFRMTISQKHSIKVTTLKI
ncbi:10739_t:CDS:2, partial [Ambispora gerdemannii]